MRKCDICGTVIPVGSNQCPNCGYQMKFEPSLKKVEVTPLPKSIKKKEKFDWGKLNKWFDGAAVAVGIVLFIVSCFDFNDPNYKGPDIYYGVQSYSILESRYPDVAKEVEPYFLHVMDMITQHGNEKSTLSENYSANEEGLYSVDINTVLFHEDISILYNLSVTPENNAYVETLAGEGESAIKAISVIIGEEYETLHGYYLQGESEYFVGDGLLAFVGDYVTYTKEIYK